MPIIDLCIFNLDITACRTTISIGCLCSIYPQAVKRMSATQQHIILQFKDKTQIVQRMDSMAGIPSLSSIATPLTLSTPRCPLAGHGKESSELIQALCGEMSREH
jgi:hypothetical protein